MGLFDWLQGKNNKYSNLEAPSAAPAPSLLPAHPASAPPPAYGIENAIDLMRGLPFDENPELVLRVLRKTLRSTGVSVEQIVHAAKAREHALSTEGAAEHSAIEQLEQQIVARRATIERLAATLHETKSARERLEHAMENETKVAPLPPDVVLQIRAEAAAQAKAQSAPPPPPPVAASPRAPAAQVPPAPKSLPPPLPKSLAPPLPNKPSPSSPSKPAPAPGAPRSVRPPALAVSRAEATVPSLVDDGDEQTDTHDATNGHKKSSD